MQSVTILGWTKFNDTCFDEDEEIDYSFLYVNSTVTGAYPYFGRFAVYGGGGYVLSLGPKQSLATTYIESLEQWSWIDQNTRAVFLDTNSFNPNTRLFSHTKIVFEFSEYGLISTEMSAYSSNLYPYVTPMDYAVLALQLIFCVIVCVKIIALLLTLYQLKLSFYKSFNFWFCVLDVTLCVVATVCYVLRIIYTTKVIEEIRNDKGEITVYYSQEFTMSDFIWH